MKKPSFVKIEHLGRANEMDDYVIGELLGRGSYASVRLSVNIRTNERVAIKIYDKARLFDPFRQKNVTKEIEILREFNHPNVIKLIKVIETKKHINLVLEMGGKQSLKDYIKSQEGKKLNEIEAIHLFTQIIKAIAYLHQRRIVHRDIKLENILIDEQKIIHLIDFGFATQLPYAPKFLQQSCGTPSYMSPELLPPSAKYNELTDVWSCGVVLHLMLCGMFPYTAKTEKELYSKIKRGAYFDRQSTFPWTIVGACLERDYCVRMSAQDILLELEQNNEQNYDN